MAKREENINKALAAGYFISKVGNMYFVMDVNEDCHGYKSEERQAENILNQLGKYI